MVLAVLADGPAHGYGVIARLRDRSAGEFDLAEGTLYPASHRLESEGRVLARWTQVQGRRRKDLPGDQIGCRGARVSATSLGGVQRRDHPSSGRGDRMSQLPDDPIERYLDQLLLNLPGTPRQVRHTLSEVEAHLHDGAAAAEAEGLDEHAAAVLAVQRMGPVDGVIDSRAFRFRLTPARRRRAVLGTLFVGSVGGIARRSSGNHGRDRADDRRRWRRRDSVSRGAYAAVGLHPMVAATQRLTTVAAMTIDHANDFLLSTTVVGFLGLVCLSMLVLLRRRWNSHAVATVIPAYTEDVAAAVMALLAAVYLLAQGVDSVLVTRGQGAGQWFCLAAARGWRRGRMFSPSPIANPTLPVHFAADCAVDPGCRARPG